MTGDIKLIRTLLFIAAQLIGGIAGAALLKVSSQGKKIIIINAFPYTQSLKIRMNTTSQPLNLVVTGMERISWGQTIHSRYAWLTLAVMFNSRILLASSGANLITVFAQIYIKLTVLGSNYFNFLVVPLWFLFIFFFEEFVYLTVLSSKVASRAFA